jgi:hypothetical protein
MLCVVVLYINCYKVVVVVVFFFFFPCKLEEHVLFRITVRKFDGPLSFLLNMMKLIFDPF